MTKMILAGNDTGKCPYGCCGTLPDARHLGTHASASRKAVKRSLKKRDRQGWKKMAMREVS
jgi:hypothetical protein